MLSRLRQPFTATSSQIATYLLGVAFFSISFLVFLNSSISFVITDLIGQKSAVGNAVGTLGFADELLALLACPFWGLVSDRLGVRWVCFIGYATIGLALLLVTQTRNVFPELLLARLLFSAGGAATSTMVTAILPSMTLAQAPRPLDPKVIAHDENSEFHDNIQRAGSSSSTETSAAARPQNGGKSSLNDHSRSANSQTAGLVGMFTGLGALIALWIFLPLPVLFQSAAYPPSVSLQKSFAIVACFAFAVSVICFLGLRGLPGEARKGWSRLVGKPQTNEGPLHLQGPTSTSSPQAGVDVASYAHLACESIHLGLADVAIGLGYLGGFVARASSVGISLFIPLYVNAFFVSHGLCDNTDTTRTPSDVKSQCSRAYKLAGALTGASQLVALLCAPLFGYLDARFRRFNVPLLFAAAAGIAGYVALTQTKSPEIGSGKGGGPLILLIMALIGISQIGAIVCSLSSLGRGIQGPEAEPKSHMTITSLEDNDHEPHEHSALLGAQNSSADHEIKGDKGDRSRNELKGSIAGLYSFFGGAGILLLTKLGGYLFDRVSTGAPFYMLASFNAVLLVAGGLFGITREARLWENHFTDARDMPT